MTAQDTLLSVEDVKVYFMYDSGGLLKRRPPKYVKAVDGISFDVKRGESQQVQQMRPREIEGLWRQEVTANPNLIAAVKTHPEASYKFMMDVLDARWHGGGEAGGANLSLPLALLASLSNTPLRLCVIAASSPS